MNSDVLTEYVKYLNDQRMQLEATIFSLRKEINDLNSKATASTDTSGSVPGEVHTSNTST